jgi:hypothetical protein
MEVAGSQSQGIGKLLTLGDPGEIRGKFGAEIIQAFARIWGI